MNDNELKLGVLKTMQTYALTQTYLCRRSFDESKKHAQTAQAKNKATHEKVAETFLQRSQCYREIATEFENRIKEIVP